MKSVTL